MMPGRLYIFGQRVVLLFIAFFVITLPFPYSLLPSTGRLFAPLSTALINFSNKYLFDAEPGSLVLASDSAGMYIHLFNIFALAILFAGIWAFIDRRENMSKVIAWARIFCSYYLSLQLFKYGVEKILKIQFYQPEPNILYTPLGQLTPDILYWSTMGSSYTYSVFMGIAEVLPALLLLFRRTRGAGGLIAAGVLLNVVMVNIGFDITVKIYSTFLLLISCFVAWPAKKSLYLVYFLHKAPPGEASKNRFNSKRKIIAYSLLKSIAVMIILFEACYVHLRNGNLNDDAFARPPLHGAYEVLSGEALEGELQPDYWSGSRRFFFHRDGYFIAQSKDENSFEDYYCRVDTLNRSIQISSDRKRAPATFTFKECGDTLQMWNTSARYTLKKIDLSQLPLLKHRIHFIEHEGE